MSAPRPRLVWTSAFLGAVALASCGAAALLRDELFYVKPASRAVYNPLAGR